MGQEITAIITNQLVEIDKEIVHFKQGDCLIIPIDVDPYHLEHFIDQAAKFFRIEELLDDLELKTGSGCSIEDYSHPDEENEHRHSLKTLIDLVRSMKLQNFVLHYFSDFASMSTDEYFMFVRGGEIVRESVMLCTDGLDMDDYIPFMQELGMNTPYWFADEETYHRYSTAEEVYSTRNSE